MEVRDCEARRGMEMQKVAGRGIEARRGMERDGEGWR